MFRIRIERLLKSYQIALINDNDKFEVDGREVDLRRDFIYWRILLSHVIFLEMSDMKYIKIIAIVIILLVPSIVFYSPEVEITRDVTPDTFEGTRSGPQTYQNDMGGWWMQDEDKDFEGGELEDTEINTGGIELGVGPMPFERWYWTTIGFTNFPKLSGHGAAYDEENNRMILFGGVDNNVYKDETWVLDLENKTWIQRNPNNHPAERRDALMTYDSHNKKIVLCGGTKQSTTFSDTWTYDYGTNTWTKISNQGPTEASYRDMAFDQEHNRVVLFGGSYYTRGENYYLRETWILDVATGNWDQVSSSGPHARAYHAMEYNPHLKKVILQGGYFTERINDNYRSYDYCDTWAFDLQTNQWTELSPDGPIRSRHSMVYDSNNNFIVQYGGQHNYNKYDTFIFNPISYAWIQRTIPYISSHSNPQMVYDTQHKQVVLVPSSGWVDDVYVLKSSEKASEGAYTSPVIELPPGYEWNDLTISRNEPNGTSITISLMDAETDLYVPGYQNVDPHYIALSNIETKSLKLRCHFEGDNIFTPSLDSWKVTWKKKIPKPEYLGGIPSNVPVTEDTPRAGILDLSDYFGETRSDDFTYQIESITDNLNINVVINDSYLDVTYLKDNWTGKTDLVVNCTNTYDESVSSDKFSIVVQRVDDAPVWSSKLPPISIDEDGGYTSDFSYTDYLLDAEKDLLSLSVACNIPNITVQMSPEGYLSISPEENYFGFALITLTASEIYNPALKTVATLVLTINGVNDDPTIKLLSPGDGAVYNDTAITLSWSAEDIDTPDEDITFDLYFGDQESPVLYMSDITDNSVVLSDLPDKTLYYWYLVAKDGNGGEATSPTWSLSIDTESEVIPGDTETDSGDLNVTILVDATKVVVEQGKETSFDLEIKNDGEKPVTLTIVTSGDVAPCLSLNNFITLAPLEKKTEIVKITRTALMEPGNYTISLVFVSPDGMKYVSVPLWIQKNRTVKNEPKNGDDDDEPLDSTQTKADEKSEDYLWVILVIVFLLFLVILLSIMSTITNSKLRSRVNELEKSEVDGKVLEGDAYIPQKTSFQSEIEGRTQIPLSPGPYQPLEFPGQPFQPHVATFQSQQSAAPQLPTSQPVTTSVVPPVSTQPMPEVDISAILGTPPVGSPTVSTTAQQSTVPQTPQPLVQLPPTTGVAQQQEQKMLPENATGAPPPPDA